MRWLVVMCSWGFPVGAEQQRRDPEPHDHERHVVHEANLRVTLEQAMALAAERGPETARTSAVRRAAEDVLANASPVVAQLPYVQTQLGPRFTQGKSRPEVIVSATQPFVWGDVSGVQRRVAQATQRVVNTAIESAQWSDAERAAHAWIDLALANRVLSLRQAFVQRARALVILAEARVAAGQAEPLEQALAQSELSEGEELVIEAEGALFAAEVELGYAIGARSNTVVHIDGELELPEMPERGDKRAHPEVAAAESRFELAHEQVAYAEVQQSPVVSLGLQYQREGTGEQIITAVATIPLPVASPWAFQRSQQRLASEGARAEAAHTQKVLNKELMLAKHEASHARSRYTHLLERALPPQREALRLARVRYEVGESDLTMVTIVQQRVLRAEEQLAQALADVNHTHVRLQAAQGSLLGAIQ